MNTQEQKVMKKAMEYLQDHRIGDVVVRAIKEVLAQQSNEQVEPVKVGRITDNIKGMVLRQEVMLYTDDYLPIGTALYTTPPVPYVTESRTAQPKEHDDSAVHFAHCNIGENEGCCKYGDDDCPVIANLKAQPKKQDWKVLPKEDAPLVKWAKEQGPVGLIESLKIAHIDGNKQNNLIENLRDVDNTLNHWNERKRSTNKSGHKGVWWHKQSKRWEAACRVNGKQITIGRFERIEDAVEAVRKFREQQHGEYANHG